MSRIGKKPISLPSSVSVKFDDKEVKIKGPLGELGLLLPQTISIEQADQSLLIKTKNPDSAQDRALWGLYRSLVNNMVLGVTSGFSKILEINGVGFKAQLSGKKLTLNLGYSHPIEMEIPPGIDLRADKNTLTITGIDRQQVGQFAADIRSQRKPEPYKGKGIKYSDEVVRRKAGKVVKAVGAK